MSSDILLYSCYRYSKFYRKKLLQVARCILHASTRLPDGERTGQDRTGFQTLTRSHVRTERVVACAYLFLTSSHIRVIQSEYFGKHDLV